MSTELKTVAWVLTNGRVTNSEYEQLAHAYQGNEAADLVLRSEAEAEIARLKAALSLARPRVHHIAWMYREGTDAHVRALKELAQIDAALTSGEQHGG